MKEIRLAIIGTRGIGRRHAEAIIAAGNAKITACAAKTRESAKSFQEKYSVPFATTRPLDIARRNEVDAAVICTPNKFHAPYTLAMIEAGKHVLLEKPMAANAKESKQIMDTAKKKRRVILVGHMWRFDDEIMYVRKIVASGMIGEPIKTKAYGVHVNWGPSGWFTQKSLAKGGALADMGIHAIDTTRYVLGDPLPEKVYAAVGTYYGDYDVDDTGMVMITWKTGAVSIIEFGWRQPHSDRPAAGVQIFGTRGYVSAFPTEIKTGLYGRPGKFQPQAPDREKHKGQEIYDRQMKHFLDCIRSGKTPSPGAGEGHVNMRIVDAAYKSSQTRKAVRL